MAGPGSVGQMVKSYLFPIPPRETWLLVEVTEVKDRFLRGRIRGIGRPSLERTEPLCGSYGTCGGCHCQHLRYDRQLHWKQVQVKDALVRIGGLVDPPLAPIIPSPMSYHYRGKAEFHVAN